MSKPKGFFYRYIMSLFNSTKDDKYIPTNLEIDQELDKLKYCTHYIYPVLVKVIKLKIIYCLKYKWRIYVFWIIVGWILKILLIYSYINYFYPKYIQSKPIIIKQYFYIQKLRTFNEFLNAVGCKESGNNWSSVSKNGMLGRYQFEPNTLKSIGIIVDKEDFLSDTLLQTAAFRRLLYLNSKIFEKYLLKYKGKKLPQSKEIIMTESGILMAFHLKPSAARVYFDSDCKTNNKLIDGNGTPIWEYIKLFSGYELN